MNTLITDKKYTLVLSAFQHAMSDLDNYINTMQLLNYIEHECHCHAIQAVGCYKGASELSFVVHTNSSNTMVQIRTYAYDTYKQESVLISNNRKRTVALHYSNAMVVLNLGIGFKRITKHDALHLDAFTALNGKDYWVVV